MTELVQFESFSRDPRCSALSDTGTLTTLESSLSGVRQRQETRCPGERVREVSLVTVSCAPLPRMGNFRSLSVSQKILVQDLSSKPHGSSMKIPCFLPRKIT